MSISVGCQSCGETFEAAVPRGLDRRATCPICGVENDVPVVSAATGTHSVRPEDRSGISLVRIGLNLVLIATLVFVAQFLMLLLADLNHDFDLAEFLFAIHSYVMTAVGIAMCVGVALCIAVPERSRARGLALATTMLAVVFLLGELIVLWAMDRFDLDSFVRAAFVLMVVGSIDWVLFLLFLMRAGRYVDDEANAKRARSVLVISGLLVLLWVGGGTIHIAVGQEVDAVTMVVGIGSFILGIVGFARYVATLSGISNSMRRALRGT